MKYCLWVMNGVRCSYTCEEIDKMDINDNNLLLMRRRIFDAYINVTVRFIDRKSITKFWLRLSLKKRKAIISDRKCGEHKFLPPGVWLQNYIYDSIANVEVVANVKLSALRRSDRLCMRESLDPQFTLQVTGCSMHEQLVSTLKIYDIILAEGLLELMDSQT